MNRRTFLFTAVVGWLAVPIPAHVQAGVTMVTTDLSTVRVFPNPWRADRHTGRNVTFDQLPTGSTIKIFTVSGHQVTTLSPSGSTVSWNLTNDSGDKVASGIYLYVITAEPGLKKTGQVAVIK